jgi:uncharacterized protein YdbL (DUF1318 family)
MIWKRAIIVVAVAAGANILACHTKHDINITAHVTLDIRHVQAQTDDLYGYIAGEKPLDALEAGKPQAMSAPGTFFTTACRLFDTASSADAAEKEYSEGVVKAVKKLASYAKELKKHKNTGCIGEKNDGYIVYRKCEACEKDAEIKKAVEELVKKVNADRKLLFEEHARQEGASEAGALKIQLTWAAKFREEANTGQWIQAPEKMSDFRDFEKSKIGAKLAQAGEIKKEEWYQVPKGFEEKEEK